VTLTERVRDCARDQGFVACAITGAEPFREAGLAALERTQAGLMDGLTWWSQRRAQQSADPRQSTPTARSVIALAYPYPCAPDSLDGGGDARRGPSGRVAAYALGRDYHDVLKERMEPICALLRAHGCVARTYVDHGWLLDRAAAARAGLGWLGKNTNLLIPGIGSYVFLAEIVTSADLEPALPVEKSCGACDACLRVCPTGALVAPGVLDNWRCISFWTIEHRGVIPREIRLLLGDWIFGCDLCQEVCPVNAGAVQSASSSVRRAFGPALPARLSLEAILALDEEGFRSRYQGTAIFRARRSGLRRNACIALGNLGDRSSVPLLARALSDDDALVRGHAAWALGRLGGAAARRHLEGRLAGESDAWVAEECRAALEACGPLVISELAAAGHSPDLAPAPAGPSAA
jgi:epoxyqueuosine reductase